MKCEKKKETIGMLSDNDINLMLFKIELIHFPLKNHDHCFFQVYFKVNDRYFGIKYALLHYFFNTREMICQILYILKKKKVYDMITL